MSKSEAKAREIRPYEMGGRFGILNHMGQFWTCETFSSAPQAQKYLDAYQNENKNCNLRRHKVVPVSVTVTAAPAKRYIR